jgi:hypothetical protein
MPIIQPNNTTGLYGVDTTVTINNAVTGNSLNIQGNASISGNLAVGGQISATGNITTAGFFVGNFAGNISGNIVVPGSNTQVLFNNNGLAGASADLTFNDATNVLSTSGNVIAAGNISGNYILGNGSQLTGLPATYSNANVTSLLASFGSNTISGTGNITTTANIAGGFILGNGSQLTGLPALYGNANVTSLLASFGSNTISTTGNVTAGNFIGNGQYLTNINAGNITGAYGNANVAAFMAAFGSNTISTTGNVTAGNVNVGTLSVGGFGFNTGTTTLTTNGVIGWAGNFTGLIGYNTGNTGGNALVIADGANGIVELGVSAFPNPGSWVFDNANGNLTLPGNTSAINYANGTSILSGVVVPAGGSNTQIQFNDSGAFAGNATFTFNKVNGNVNVPVLISAGNLTSTQQTVIGTANVGTTGNIVISGKNIATDMAWIPDGGNTATAVNGRVVIGTGFNGNIAHSAIQQRLVVSDSYNRSNTGTAVRMMAAEAFITLTGNVTNTNTRNQAFGSTARFGGGSAANTMVLTTSPAAIFGAAPGQFNLDIGNISPYNLGNTTIGHATLNGGSLAIAPGSNLNNGYGFFTNLGGVPGAGVSGNLVNYIGYSTNYNMNQVPTGNIYSFYHGSNATGSVSGAGTNNTVRQAPVYYAFYNADDLAQIQLGSLRRYHEFEAATATSGSFAIDKNTAQVHNIVPTGNCTITGYSNMVVSVSDGSTSDAQVDTLTIIIEQGTTPYTVTLPTGAAFKYAGGVNTVGTTANAVTMISVTAANVRGTTTYLTTVSPEFV